jgi:hypothetical protein
VHEVRSGRFDLQVLIADEDGEVVPICRHTALIVGAERAHKRRLAEGRRFNFSSLIMNW